MKTTYDVLEIAHIGEVTVSLIDHKKVGAKDRYEIIWENSKGEANVFYPDTFESNARAHFEVSVSRFKTQDLLQRKVGLLACGEPVQRDDGRFYVPLQAVERFGSNLSPTVMRVASDAFATKEDAVMVAKEITALWNINLTRGLA